MPPLLNPQCCFVSDFCQDFRASHEEKRENGTNKPKGRGPMKRKSQFGGRTSELGLLGWTLLSTAMIALLVPVAIAADDESAAKLPEDGAWVRYEAQWGGGDDGAKSVRKTTLSFVGRVIEKDEPCQWIEI